MTRFDPSNRHPNGPNQRSAADPAVREFWSMARALWRRKQGCEPKETDTIRCCKGPPQTRELSTYHTHKQ